MAELQGLLGTSVARDRSEGFKAGMKECPGVQVVAVQSADFDRGKALDVTTNILQANPGITGISHFFEHMMFNGTKTRRPGEFDRIMEGNGGRNNAYTSSDVTVYQDWFPRGALELVFDLEADRMRNLDFDPKAVESERGVVYSERRSSVDNKYRRLDCEFRLVERGRRQCTRLRRRCARGGSWSGKQGARRARRRTSRPASPGPRRATPPPIPPR